MKISNNRRVLNAAIMASVAGAALVCAPSAFAQAAPQAAAEPNDDAATAAIVVLGRRTDRSVVDSASPIDVIGAAELNTQPASNLLDVVRNLIPSFYVGQNSISDASTFVRSQAATA